MIERIGSLKIILSECPHCGHPIVVNGPLTTLKCSSCHDDVQIAPQQWQTLFGKLDDAIEIYGAGHESTDEIEDKSHLKVTFKTLSALNCIKCETVLNVTQISAAANSLSCHQCGHSHTLSAPPDTIRYSNAKFVVNGLLAQEDESIDAETVTPVSMGCPNCSASLKITTDKTRVTVCEYCNGEFLIPAPIWSKLHPVQKAEEWHVLFEGETNHSRLQQQERRESLEAQKQAIEKRRKALSETPTNLRSDYISTFKIGLGGFAILGIVVGAFLLFFSDSHIAFLGDLFCDGTFSVSESTWGGTSSGTSYSCEQNGTSHDIGYIVLIPFGIGVLISCLLWTLLFAPFLYFKNRARVKEAKAELAELNRRHPPSSGNSAS